MFLQPDERILIMDSWNRPLTADEMRALHVAGVQTVYYQGGVRWDEMQPQPNAPMDYSQLDAYMDRARWAGLKVLLPFCWSFPAWKPDDWFYSREVQEGSYGIMSYTNPVTALEIDSFMTALINRYRMDDFQLVFALPCNGEFPYHKWPIDGRWHTDPDALIDWVCKRQEILAAQHGEVWSAYHPYTNPEYWHPLHDALFNRFFGCRHYGIIFTYVQHSQPHIKPLLDYNKQHGMTYYVGTEYVQGMRSNMDKIKRGGMRMLTAPKHPYQSNDKVEPWMLNTIMWANEELANAKI